MADTFTNLRMFNYTWVSAAAVNVNITFLHVTYCNFETAALARVSCPTADALQYSRVEHRVTNTHALLILSYIYKKFSRAGPEI